MRPQLLLEVSVGAPSSQRCPDPDQPFAKRARHGDLPARPTGRGVRQPSWFRSACMMPVIRSHACFSAASSRGRPR